MKATFLFSLLMLTACGDGEATASFETSVKWMAQITCAERADLVTNMRATLDVGGGFERRELTVDDDLTVHGTYEGITVGISRPLGLGYWYYVDTVQPRVPLLFIIGFIDLEDDNIAKQGTVEVTLDGDGVESVVVDAADKIDALPDAEGECSGLADKTATEICEAKVWAKTQIFVANQIIDLDFFDRDSDTTNNLTEACAGTLLD